MTNHTPENQSTRPIPETDLFIIGGGINGCGIARDAAGRGLSVFLCEREDLAAATSSASTKLFHGGLRYLEYYEFRLVREALLEREVLLKAMPHISWPLRFVLPHHSGLRPRWMVRIGLFMYDHLGGRKILPASKSVDLTKHITGRPLKNAFSKGFEYSDCWVEDARLVSLNARDAADRGATIRTRTEFVTARREDNRWIIDLNDLDSDQQYEVSAKAIVNAGGPWVGELLNQRLRQNSSEGVRLVRGSHIVTKKLFEHEQPYIFQQSDGRIIFAIPYEEDFTLIGTTDQDHEGDASEAHATQAEQDYLRKAAAEYFQQSISAEDVVWTYSGVRPLYDDNAKSATAATREYVLSVSDANQQLPLLNVFGGKITTYRRLAEAALAKLKPYFPDMKKDWTAGVALAGGDFPVDGRDRLIAELHDQYAFLDARFAKRLVKAYGTEAKAVLGDAEDFDALGRHFGWNLTEREVRWLMQKEWAKRAEDVVWRRSKIGLRLSQEEIDQLDEWMLEIQNN